jgi:methionyl-tRNA formyltransferase
MAKNKRSARRALEHLLELGWEVCAVVAPTSEPDTPAAQSVDRAAAEHGLRLASESELYAQLSGDDQGLALDEVDLVVSFLFWNRIRMPLIELGHIGCLNFHPAPLPEMRGLGGYNVAIVEGFNEWGVSAHFVDADFDTGHLVRVDRFPIDPRTVTAFALDLESQERLLGAFRAVMATVDAGEELPREPQGEGRYVSRDEYERLRRVPEGASAEEVERRIRAFWYPPHAGATVEIGGREFTLVDKRTLSDVAAQYRSAGLFP